jgi:hypothetical protein
MQQSGEITWTGEFLWFCQTTDRRHFGCEACQPLHSGGKGRIYDEEPQ